MTSVESLEEDKRILRIKNRILEFIKNNNYSIGSSIPTTVIIRFLTNSVNGIVENGTDISKSLNLLVSEGYLSASDQISVAVLEKVFI